MKRGLLPVPPAIVALCLIAFSAAPSGAAGLGDYAVESLGEGAVVALTQPGATTPALELAGAKTTASIDDTPSARGVGQGRVPDASPSSRAETEAPPNESQNATGPASACPANPLIACNFEAPEGHSESSVVDGFGKTLSSAEFGVGSVSLLPGSPVEAMVEIAGFSTEVAAGPVTGAPTATAETPGTIIDITITAPVSQAQIDQICGALGAIPVVGPTLEAECRAALGAVSTSTPFATITIGPSSVTCSWDGETAEAGGDASTASIELFGQDPIDVDPGQAQTIGAGTPLETTVIVGGVSIEQVEGSASAAAAGAAILIGAQDPPIVQIAQGLSTCGVSGAAVSPSTTTTSPTTSPPGTSPTTDLPRTGAELPGGSLAGFLLGALALAAAGLGSLRLLSRH